jgi:hypothetical protein
MLDTKMKKQTETTANPKKKPAPLPDALTVVNLLEKCAEAEGRRLLFEAARLIRAAYLVEVK